MSFKTLSWTLESVHAVHPRFANAFRSRLKNFQRLGFPPGVNTGKGKPAEYSPEAFLLLAVAMEMVQLGMTPERVIQLVGRHQQTILSEISSTLELGSAEALMYFDPQALSPFQFETVKNAPGADIHFGPPSALTKELRYSARHAARIAVVHLRKVVANAIAAWALADEGDLREQAQSEFLDWAISYGSNQET